MQLPKKKTKIVCTIGPASDDQATLEKMIKAGMNVARLNFAHGDREGHCRIIENVRAAAASVGARVTIMGDLPGPKIRLGQIEGEPIMLERGHQFILQPDEIVGNTERASVNFPQLLEVAKPGDIIFLNDGFIQFEVKKVADRELHGEIITAGELRSHKGVNLPDIDLGISAFTDEDRRFLAFAAEQKLDAISQSFVESAADIEAVREAAGALNYQPFIIAKIERSRAVTNLPAILQASDGIMVARGDLGVETPIEQIAVTQKWIIHRANVIGKPVITATHMLESMVDNRRPTRAEATDVANAILDGTDCVMLSEESAVGVYPEYAVEMLSRIAAATEPTIDSTRVVEALSAAKRASELDQGNLIALSIYNSVDTLKPTALITPTSSGNTTRLFNRFRLPVWIVAISSSQAVCQGLQFSYGVYPIHEPERPDSWVDYARDWLERHELAHDLALLTQDVSSIYSGGTSRLDIIDFHRGGS